MNNSPLYGNIDQTALDTVINEVWTPEGYYDLTLEEELRTMLINGLTDEHVIHAEYRLDETNNYFEYFVAWTPTRVLTLFYDTASGNAFLEDVERNPPTQ